MKSFAHFLTTHRSALSLALVFAFLLGYAFIPEGVQAQSFLEDVGRTVGFSDEPLPIVIAKLVRAFLGVIGIIVVIVIMYAGWLYLSSQGEAEKLTKAKMILRQTFVGLLIIFGSFVLTQFILNALGGGSGTSTGGIRTTAPTAGFFEPRSGSLGAGIVEDHFPERNAIDVARNTGIFVTFREPIDPASFALNFDPADDQKTYDLNTDQVLIFPTEQGEDGALDGKSVRVSIDAEGRTVVFDPVDPLGSASVDTNYTVFLKPSIQLADGSAAFSGVAQDGYSWTFEVSTEIDDTPPYVTSFVPPNQSSGSRNTAVEITFSEPMHPLTVSGSFGSGAQTFRHIEMIAEKDNVTLPGSYRLSNNYRTVSFVTSEACAQDLCGNTVYCLPADAALRAEVHAATVSAAAPAAELIGGGYDGVVDASGNSLDGVRDYQPERARETLKGSPEDDVVWRFRTNDLLDRRTPRLDGVTPSLDAEYVNPDDVVSLLFSMPLLSSSVKGSTVLLLPETSYELPFWLRSSTANDHTTVDIQHPTLVSNDDGSGLTYYPVVTEGVRGINQFCAYPSDGPEAVDVQPDEVCGTVGKPFCCFGRSSASACTLPGEVPVIPSSGV